EAGHVRSGPVFQPRIQRRRESRVAADDAGLDRRRAGRQWHILSALSAFLFTRAVAARVSRDRPVLRGEAELRPVRLAHEQVLRSVWRVTPSVADMTASRLVGRTVLRGGEGHL